jgi:hypothetical protein
MADVDSDSPIRVTEFEERQRLKQVEDRVLDLQLVFESTLDTVDSLLRAYEKYTFFCEIHDTVSGGPETDVINLALTEKRRELQLYLAEVAALRSKVQSTASMVSRDLTGFTKISFDPVLRFPTCSISIWGIVSKPWPKKHA